ncbi:hypothetical protein BR93DRAFT_581998 [Coniochaeta sp. PMI_546]|nr:hypothetical protein BR93DRAFT_581998 [Coniochaeta sp. PMI_546]
MNRVFVVILTLVIVASISMESDTTTEPSRNRALEVLNRSEVDERQVHDYTEKTGKCTTIPELPNLLCCWSGRRQETRVDKRGCGSTVGDITGTNNAQHSSFLYEALTLQRYMRALPNNVALSCSPRVA